MVTINQVRSFVNPGVIICSLKFAELRILTKPSEFHLSIICVVLEFPVGTIYPARSFVNPAEIICSLKFAEQMILATSPESRRDSLPLEHDGQILARVSERPIVWWFITCTNPNTIALKIHFAKY